MESSKEKSDWIEVLIKEIHERTHKEHPLSEDHFDERLDYLEEKIQKLFWFIEFHLGEVPLKYQKFNPQDGEYPYFKCKTSFKPNVDRLADYEPPSDPKEYAEAKERMKEYAKMKDRKEQICFELIDENYKTVREVDTKCCAEDWVRSGPQWYVLFEDLNYKDRTRLLEEAQKWKESSESRYFHKEPARSYTERTRLVDSKPES